MNRLALLACATALLAGPAVAQSVTVRYGDIDLGTETGARVMLARVGDAARRVCGPSPVVADVGRYEAYRDCLHATVRKAVADLNAPLVTTAYAGRGSGGQSLAAVGEAR